MASLKQIWQVCLYNFRGWKNNPRIIITFGLAFVLCFLLTDKAVRFSYEYETILQAVEPFIWSFGDATSIMIASLLLILLFADMPFLGAGVPFYLMRTTRLKWMIGQVLYISLATLIYMLFMLLSSIIICAKQAFPGNMWSETGAILGYSGAGKALNLPSTVKAMEMSTPYQAMATIFLLMLLYTLLLVMLIFFMNLKKGKFWGIASVFAFSVYGFLLNPLIFKQVLKLEDEQMYIANVITGWLSPLNHATFYMHNFGYDLLPRLWQTYAFFGAGFILLFFLSYRAIRSYNFNFTGGLH